MKIVAVAGLASNVGKTTLACRLLERLPGWEAIKVTKGHYRSCGKDPHACCVSHLLSDAPLVLSGRERTYAPGKDTGRYWDAGASNVHWVVATKEGVADGVREALGRVSPDCPGVVVEGTGFLASVPVDYAVMVTASAPREIKASAARVFDRADALFVSDVGACDEVTLARVRALLSARRVEPPLPPVLCERDLERLAGEILSRRGRTARAVLWDLDGTIVDSEEAHYLAWREAFMQEGAELTRERFRELFGRKNEVTVKAMLGERLSDAEVERVAHGKEERYRASVRAGGARLLPGVERWLEELRRDGWRQAIVSSAPRANVETIVAALNIAHYFRAIVGGEDVAAGKPDPSCMLLAAGRLGVDPRRCVVVEDAPAGLEAARRAEMRTVGVLTTHGALEADVVAPSLAALDASALDELLERR